MKAAQTLTISEIRSILFNGNFYAVIGADEYTNADARRFLFDMPNQDDTMNVIENGDHLLIY